MQLTSSDYSVLCFDLDDTLISDNTWYRFNTHLGVPVEKDLELYRAHSDGRLLYSDWLETLQSLYRANATKSEIEALFSKYTLTPGAREAVGHAQAKGYTLVIITGSFSEAAAAVGRELGIEYTFGVTHCTYNSSDLCTGVTSKGDEQFAKLELLTSLCQQLSVPLAQCIAVGDSDNDIPIFNAVGSAITFTNANGNVKESADIVINDLHDLVTILS